MPQTKSKGYGTDTVEKTGNGRNVKNPEVRISNAHLMGGDGQNFTLRHHAVFSLFHSCISCIFCFFAV